MSNIIAVDLCNTIFDVNKILEKTLGPSSIPSEYEYPGLPVDFFENNLWIFEKAEPINLSCECLKRLAVRNIITYITARPPQAREVTYSQLEKYGFPRGKVFFTKDKLTVAKRLGVTRAIEDSPAEIKRYIASGITVYVKKQPYNMQFDNRFEWDDFLRQVV